MIIKNFSKNLDSSKEKFSVSSKDWGKERNIVEGN